MHTFKSLLCLVFFFLITLHSFSQKQKLSGKITDLNGAPLSNASIKIKSSSTGTVSNKDGSFSIEAEPGDVLEITSVGFKAQTFSQVATDMVIKLEPSFGEITEVIVTGSRGAARVRTESPVPVDVIRVNDAAKTTGK